MRLGSKSFPREGRSARRWHLAAGPEKQAKDSNQWEPLTTQVDGEHVKVDVSMVKGDQQEALLTVMSKVKEWVERATSADPNKARTFKPLCLTVQGCAGSGKSFFAKCLVNTVREMFGCENVARVVGPTGAAAWSVGGQAARRKLAASPRSPSLSPSLLATLLAHRIAHPLSDSSSPCLFCLRALTHQFAHVLCTLV